MNYTERYKAADAIANPVEREVAQAIIETEWNIEHTTERLESARKHVEDVAARKSDYSYADTIEAWLRDWRSAYTELAELNHKLELLNHIARAGEHADS